MGTPSYSRRHEPSRWRRPTLTEKAFDVDMDMLLQMQAWHDARAMRRRTDEIHVLRYKPPAVQPR